MVVMAVHVTDPGDGFGSNLSQSRWSALWEERFFTSNLHQLRDWTPGRRATQGLGASSGTNVLGQRARENGDLWQAKASPA